METKKTRLDVQNIQDAQTAITQYINSCKEIFKKMDADITNMIAENADFNGEAAKGYSEFYEAVKPALTTNLYEGDDALMNGMSKILDAIQRALFDDMDTPLGTANKSAAPANAAAPTTTP